MKYSIWAPIRTNSVDPFVKVGWSTDISTAIAIMKRTPRFFVMNHKTRVIVHRRGRE